MMRRPVLALSLVAAAAHASPARAQQDSTPAKRQVLSIQPISAVLTVYAAEYERAFLPVFTFGLGATGFFPDEISYTSADVKVRYYPQEVPLTGFSFGGSVGFTRVSEDFEEFDGGTDSETASGPSAGVTVDYGWLLGRRRSFYVGLGAGAKVLFVDEDEFSDDLLVRYPTARLSIGYAF
jgi:hypothetical protein